MTMTGEQKSRYLERWLSAFRIIAGAIFVYMGTGHLQSGWATASGFNRAITGFSGHNPLQWYTSWMTPLVLSQPGFFGLLFVFGMIATGLGLIFGFLSVPALIAALFLNANNVLMGYAGGSVHYSLNLLMAAVAIALLQTGVWRAYSLDGLLLAKLRPVRTGAGSRLATGL